MHQNTVILEVVCKGGEVVPVRALVEGYVLEVNQRLTLDNIHKP